MSYKKYFSIFCSVVSLSGTPSLQHPASVKLCMEEIKTSFYSPSTESIKKKRENFQKSLALLKKVQIGSLCVAGSAVGILTATILSHLLNDTESEDSSTSTDKSSCLHHMCNTKDSSNKGFFDSFKATFQKKVTQATAATLSVIGMGLILKLSDRGIDAGKSFLQYLFSSFYSKQQDLFKRVHEAEKNLERASFNFIKQLRCLEQENNHQLISIFYPNLLLGVIAEHRKLLHLLESGVALYILGIEKGFLTKEQNKEDAELLSASFIQFLQESSSFWNESLTMKTESALHISSQVFESLNHLKSLTSWFFSKAHESLGGEICYEEST